MTDPKPPEDFDPYRGERVSFHAMDLPRSTLAIGVILWGVLAGLGGWTLSIVSDMRADVSGQGEGLKALQKQTDRNTDDIRELQRVRR